MRLGLQIDRFTWPAQSESLAETLKQIAQRAENAGLYSLWFMDHFFQVGFIGAPEEKMLECWTTLAFVASCTSVIKLGTLVTGITYRYPAVLVKIATTLDVLSQGRTYLGLGAAWYEDEHKGLGIPFPPLAERFERLEETLQIVQQMWAGNDLPYEGKHYQLARPLNMPQPVQRPHPPILIGGGGEQKTLRLVAQYADACNLSLRMGKDQLQRKLAVLHDHCTSVGRSYEQIEKTALWNIRLTKRGHDGSITPAAVIDSLSELADLGFNHVIISLPNVHTAEPFDLLATEVIPAVRHLG